MKLNYTLSALRSKQRGFMLSPFRFKPPPLPDTYFDPYYYNVVLSLHGNGANAGVVFYDSSYWNKTITPSGNAKTSTAQKRYGASSMLFDGAGDFLTPPAHATDWDFGTGDFTIECFFWSADLSDQSGYRVLFGGAVAELAVCLNGATLEVRNWYASGIAASPSSLVPNTWYHVAVSRTSGVLNLLLDGVLLQSVDYPTAVAYAAAPRVGASSYAFNYAYWNGYIDDLRVTKGVGRYTTPFPMLSTTYSDNGMFDAYLPTVKLLVHADGTDGSTVLVDSSPVPKTLTAQGGAALSTSLKKYGTASLYNGTAQSSNGVNVGTSADTTMVFAADFTAECWYYQTADSEFNFSTLLSRVDTSNRSSSALSSFELGVTQAGGLYRPGVNVFNTMVGSTVQNQTLAGTIATALNTWNHVAVTRSGTTLKLWVNGVQSATRAVAGAMVTNTSQSKIGASSQAGASKHSFIGYIDEVRISDGVVRYTASFTPPTAAHMDRGPQAMSAGLKAGLLTYLPLNTNASNLTATPNLVSRHGHIGWSITSTGSNLDGMSQVSITLNATSARIVSTGGDPQVGISHPSFSGNTYRYLHVRYKRITGTGAGGLVVFYAAGSHGFSGGYYKYMPEPAGANLDFVNVVFDMHALTAGGTDWATATQVTYTRFDIGSATGDTYDVEYISYSTSATAVTSSTSFSSTGAVDTGAITLAGGGYIWLSSQATPQRTQTISMWATGYGNLFIRGQDGSGGWGLLLQDDDTNVYVDIATYYNTVRQLILPHGIARATRRHYLFEFNADTGVFSLTCNNSRTGTSNTAGDTSGLREGYPSPTSYLGVALYSNAVPFYNPRVGTIDEFAVWNRILTAGEKTELYNSGHGTVYS